MCAQVSCFHDGSRDSCRAVGGAMTEFGQTSRLSQTLSERIPNGFQTDETAEIGQANGDNGFDFRILDAAFGCIAAVASASRRAWAAPYLFSGPRQLEKPGRVAFQSRLKGGRSRNLIEP